MIVVPDLFRLFYLTSWLSGPLTSTWLIGLFKNPVTPSRTSKFSDFIECDFTGYLNNGLAAFTPWIDDRYGAVMPTIVNPFYASSPFFVANTVYGAWIWDSADNALVLADLFPEPIIVSKATDAIFYSPIFSSCSLVP